MQVQAINNNNYNNKPSFKAIYKTSRIKFTPKQDEVIGDIVQKLRKPLQELNNKTPEEYYKSKNGVDFSIENYNQNEDSVCLKGLLGAEKSKNHIKQTITYHNQDSFRVGVYDSNHNFDVNDIQAGLNEHKQKEMNIMKMALLPIIGAAMFIVFGIGIRHQTKIAKPLIEKVDTVANKAKTVLPDTTKILKPIKK